jgi:hypothetical protein
VTVSSTRSAQEGAALHSGDVLDIITNHQIPGLAYAARVRGGQVSVVRGARVAVGENFVVDGVWAGEFAAGRFDDAYLAGTGLIDRGPAGVRVVASSTPSDRVLIARDGDGVVLSNSLPFLLEILGDRLDPDHLYYRNRLLAADVGLAIAPRTFPTTSGRTIRMLLGEIADISLSGAISTRLRPSDPPFRDFTHFRDHLASNLRDLIANAVDDARDHPFVPLGTLSSGYDSVAAAVLAAESGVEDFVTMLRYDGEGPERRPVDHPGVVPEKLGVQVREIERDQWHNRTDFPDAEFAAAGATFMDVVWLALEDDLPGRLLFTGQFGDNALDKGNFRVYPDISQGFGTYDARGFPEWRLRTGFAFCGVPTIGQTAQTSLFRMSNSDAMSPWSVGGVYDRPIQRRISEEAGLAREDFATKKYGGSGRVGTSRKSYTWGPRPEMMAELTEVMTDAGASSFLDFCEANQPQSHRRAFAVGRAGTWFYEKCEALNFRVGKKFHRFGIRGAVPRWVMVRLAERFRVRLDYTYLWPHWGTEMLRPRYAEAAAELGLPGRAIPA